MPDLLAASSPSSQSQLTNSPPDVQHGVIMNKLWPIKMVDGRPMTLLKFCFIDGTEERKRAVRTTILKRDRDAAKEQAKRRAEEDPNARGRTASKSPARKKSRSRSNTRTPSNPFDFVTWEDCANIEFREVKCSEADIRILFEDNTYWSQLGTDALGVEENKATMKLKQFSLRKDNLTKWDRSQILHEFGHALGLGHEHQGPAARNLLTLREELVKERYGEEYAKHNILNGAKDEDLRTYTNFDTKSIMIYPIAKDLQEQTKKLTIGEIFNLSDVDQACIKLMYPPDLRKPENHEPFRNALVTAGVDPQTAGEMIDYFVNNEGDDVAERLCALRDRFDKRNKEARLLFNSNVGVMKGIDPASLRRSGINEFVREVTKNKLFQSIMKNIVYRTMVQRGIPTKVLIPGTTQTEVTRLVAALSMHDEVGQLVRQHSVVFSVDAC